MQYFAENLVGFATTEFGWVQSYGSRCVRPPILHADVARPAPITVRWSSYAQSRMEVLEQLGTGVPRGLGPGTYDVHSPQVPSTAELTDLLRAAGRWVGPDRLWANPDRGLKTRGEPEVVASLRNLVVAAAHAVR